jgi:dynein light intermediate chain 1, cytosolic
LVLSSSHLCNSTFDAPATVDMTTFSKRPSALGNTPNFFTARPGSGKRPGTKDSADKAIWVPMLNNASRGNDLTEKQLIVLGGTPEQQREFLETVNPEIELPRYQKDRQKKRKPPISNLYALGYTYQDILDADQEDTLARLNVYMLSSPSSSFAPLLKPLLTTETVPNTLITILLDWSDPFKWPRQLRQWIRILRSVIVTLNEDVKIELQETMTAWKEKRVGPDAPTTMPGAEKSEAKQTPVVALGPGEWDEELGVPLSVVCVNAEKIERLERDFGWQEEEFDFLMQWLRCVLLKHGASLIYTTNFDTNNVRTLILSSLGIQSLLKKEIAKHNVIDRDKILVPPNWDSWGKIRIIGEGFNLEALGDAWSMEIQHPPEESIDFEATYEASDEATSAVALYEATLQNPDKDQSSYKPLIDTDAEVTVLDTQIFLAEQAAILEKYKAEDEKADRRTRKGAPAPTGSSQADADDLTVTNARMTEQIGPYQINVNGIDFDAEEATRRIRDLSDKTKGHGTPEKRRLDRSEGSEAGKSSEVYSDFFERLKQKGKGRGGGIASGSVSPTRGSPAPER